MVCRENPKDRFYRKPSFPRSRYAEGVAFLLAVAAFAFVLVFPGSSHVDQIRSFPLQVGLVLWFGLVLIVGELLRRICLLCEESRHLTLRYDSDLRFLLRSVFHCPLEAVFLIFFDILGFVLCLAAEPLLENEILTHQNLSCGIVALYLFFHLIARIQENPVDWNRELENNPVSVGQGLAYAYYYGYLKIVLPQNKTDKGLVKSFSERAEDFSCRLPKGLNDRLILKKLLIVIPESCYCTPDFQSMEPGAIERSGKMEDIYFSRAGMASRPYPVNVYRINDPLDKQPPIFVPLDMPSLLLTLLEMNSVGSSRIALSQEEKFVQLDSFVSVLKALLDEDPACRDQYEILYYKDRDESGSPVKMGELIWNHFQNRVELPA